MRANIFYQKLRSLPTYKIDIKNIRTPFGEPFDDNNHWVKTLREMDAGIIKFDQSSLYKFHKNFQPISIQDTISKYKQNIDSKVLKESLYFSLGCYPWGRWTNRQGQDQWRLSTHCGPTDKSLIEKEWKNFINLYKKIRTEGFNYSKYGRPLGLIFINKDSKKFFIMLGGNHRAAIAFVLGMKYLKVRLLPREYLTSQVVKYSDIVDNLESKILFENLINEDFVNWDY